MSAAERLAVFPRSGRPAPEVGREDVREVILRGYRIVYQVLEDRVTILTVFEGHKLLSEGVIGVGPGHADGSSPRGSESQ